MLHLGKGRQWHHLVLPHRLLAVVPPVCLQALVCRLLLLVVLLALQAHPGRLDQQLSLHHHLWEDRLHLLPLVLPLLPLLGRDRCHLRQGRSADQQQLLLSLHQQPGRAAAAAAALRDRMLPLLAVQAEWQGRLGRGRQRDQGPQQGLQQGLQRLRRRRLLVGQQQHQQQQAQVQV